MFKFMKSKKGFTLVELMIVVVIMAILVAVAVPIYNAVTENARKKTCATNRRNIVSQITNNAMSDTTILKANLAAGTTFDIITNDAGDDVDTTGLETETAKVFADTNEDGKTADTFLGMFNTENRPICPVAGGKLTVTVSPDAKDPASLNVTVDCSGTPNHDA